VLEGTTINTIYGYPDVSATGIVAAANISSANYQISGTTSPLTIAPNGVTTVSGCSVLYTVATATAAASASLQGSSAGCK
jgi:hypothetical protein